MSAKSPVLPKVMQNLCQQDIMTDIRSNALFILRLPNSVASCFSIELRRF